MLKLKGRALINTISTGFMTFFPKGKLNLTYQLTFFKSCLKKLTFFNQHPRLGTRFDTISTKSFL